MKVLAFGELMMRLVPEQQLRLEQASRLDVSFGGAEANTVASLSLQGDEAVFFTAVPLNRLGDCALRSLQSYGVDIAGVLRRPGRLGMYCFEPGASERGNSCLYDRAGSVFSCLAESDVAWDELLDGVDVLYASGITPALSSGMARICEEGFRLARKRKIATVFDVNYRGKLWSARDAQTTAKRLLPYVDTLIANDEDVPLGLGLDCVTGDLSCGIDERLGYVEMARLICGRYGVKRVASVIRNVRCTDRSQWMGMLYEANEGVHCFSRVHDVHVLEGEGAGDAFNAGLIHAMLHEMDVQGSIDYAVAAAALKLAIRGTVNVAKASEIAALASYGAEKRIER